MIPYIQVLYLLAWLVRHTYVLRNGVIILTRQFFHVSFDDVNKESSKNAQQIYFYSVTVIA
jgi:hypothetical protein